MQLLMSCICLMIGADINKVFLGTRIIVRAIVGMDSGKMCRLMGEIMIQMLRLSKAVNYPLLIHHPSALTYPNV